MINKYLVGRSEDRLREFPDNYFDSVITDPPYGLSFMGKRWDYDVPSIELWEEVLRVAKPGATLLCFAGSRTQHRMAVNIEDAGWILKDCIMWIYGSGFPKATDISKQLDKRAGIEREVIGEREGTFADIRRDEITGQDSLHGGDKAKERPRIKSFITTPSTPEAQLWDGWKSHGLKPAYEPILIALKPNEGSYAANALTYGVAGLNIEGSRIGTEDTTTRHNSSSSYMTGTIGQTQPKIERYKTGSSSGRYPANIILDEEAAEMLDEQSGVSKSVMSMRGLAHTGRHGGLGDLGHNLNLNSNSIRGHNDSGGASRFFYCAKASKAERNAGCEDFEKEIGHNRFDKCEVCGGYILQNPDRNSACKCENPVRRNNRIKGNYHPTVKPLKLIEYLCKLTKTPTGGIVLDPFAGSGTTGLACINTGRDYILIDINPEFREIFIARSTIPLARAE